MSYAALFGSDTPDSAYRCPDCGEVMNRTVITDSGLDTWGLPSDRKALVHGSGDFMHLHRVVIAPIGALSVRWAVRRWWHRTHLQLSWRFGSLRQMKLRDVLGAG